MPALTSSEAETRLHSIPAWRIEGGELTRTFTHKDFVAALAFVNRVGDLAEKAGHHPDIDIRYNKVRLGLVTHDAGGITAKDFDLAAADANRILVEWLWRRSGRDGAVLIIIAAVARTHEELRLREPPHRNYRRH